MAPPDEPTAEEDLLKRLESPPCQHRVADPGGLPEVTLDGSRADPGVGAPPNESTVRPTRSAHAKRRRGSRLRRKNPLRSLTAAKWTRRGPPRSTSSKLRMRPPRARSALPLRSASTVPPPCVAVVSAISRPSAARWPP